MFNTLEAEQVRLEAEMSERGIQRFLEKAQEDRQNGEATRTKSVKTVMEAAIVPVSKGIDEFLEEASSGKAGRRHLAAHALRHLKQIETAFIAVKITLDGLAYPTPLTGLAVRIGREVELEQRLRKFSKDNSEAFKEATEVLDRQTTHLGHRKKVYKAVLSQNNDGWEKWSESDCCRVGLKLIEIIIQKTGLVETVIYRKFKRTTSYIRATSRFSAWLSQLDNGGALMLPEYYPTVIPPKRWTGLTGGGYHTNHLEPLKLVKTRNKEHRQRLKKADLSNIINAINTLQNTAWSINTKVLEVATLLQTYRHPCAGLPSWEDQELPPKPFDIDTNPAAKRLWKRNSTKVHAHNVSEMSKRLQALRIMEMARKFSQYERFYFPYQTDFRGRIYAVPQTLNPQGTDFSKALLHFADGDKINSHEAEMWFFIHGANCYGEDKVSFGDRCRWVRENHEKIISSANEPLDNPWWMEADKPFCFLAWCFEYAEYVVNPSFTSRVPIAMDGSCNGLQHYSAMLLDPVGGKATNLIPSDTPQDIYGEVAQAVIKNISEVLRSGNERDAYFARGWSTFPIDRKITKRPVMVLPYGGMQSSCQKYVLDAVKEKIADGVVFPFPEEELFPASIWLGIKVWEAIGEVVIGARLAMEWLKKAARLLSHNKLPIHWTSPSGFPVVQSYPEIRKWQITTILLGQRFDPRMTEEIDNTIDKRRQQNGIAPNFVHSYDAAALVLTVLKAKNENISQYAMIHDSYATTAKHTATLAKCIREAFVEMYEGQEILMNFKTEAIPDDLKDKLDEPPFVGGFSISEVQNSPFFFA